MKIIALAQHKGGTGKTTTTMNLGHGLAKAGKKVLLVDMDAQANLTDSVDIIDSPLPDVQNMYHYITMKNRNPKPLKVNENLYILPSSIDLAGAETEMNSMPNRDNILSRILGKINGFDFVLIDCPPSLGVLTLNALMAANQVIIPMEAEPFPLKGLSNLSNVIELIQEVSEKKINIMGILITKSSGTVLNRDIVSILKSNGGYNVFDVMIRKNVSVSESVTHKSSVFDYAPESNGAKDYQRFVELVLRETGNN